MPGSDSQHLFFKSRMSTKEWLLTSHTCLRIPILAVAAVAGLLLACKHLGLIYAAQDRSIGVTLTQGGVSTELSLQHNIGRRPQKGVPRILLQPCQMW